MDVAVMWSVNIGFFYLSITCVYGQLGGPYDLNFQRIEECEETGTHDFVVNVKTKQVNKMTLRVTGNLSLGYDISDKMLTQVSVGPLPSESGVDWNKTIRVFTKNFGGSCSTIRTFAPETAKQLFKLMGTPPNQCPKKGKYFIDGDLEFKLTGIPVMVYGKFRLDMLLHWASYSKKIGCFFLVTDFVPKRAGKRRKGK